MKDRTMDNVQNCVILTYLGHKPINWTLFYCVRSCSLPIRPRLRPGGGGGGCGQRSFVICATSLMVSR
jgi:hypothetical protein